MQTTQEEIQFDVWKERRDLRNRLEDLCQRMRTAESDLLVSFRKLFVAVKLKLFLSQNQDVAFKQLTSVRAQASKRNQRVKPARWTITDPSRSAHPMATSIKTAAR